MQAVADLLPAHVGAVITEFFDAKGNFTFPLPDGDRFPFSEAEDWLSANRVYLLYAALSYVPMIWLLEVIMRNRKPMSLKGPLVVWNLVLAVYSGVSAYYLVPDLAQPLLDGVPLIHAGCSTSVWHTRAGWFGFVFCLSKIPEFMDTVFLRLRKRPVIFLHWFHHIVTMVYCWHAAAVSTRYNQIGLYFGGMNLLVHTVMYSYYALAAMGLGRRMSRLGLDMIITTGQIMQMLGGVYLVFLSSKCPRVEPVSLWFGGIMYAIYLTLFVHLFGAKYFTKQGAKIKDA